MNNKGNKKNVEVYSGCAILACPLIENKTKKKENKYYDKQRV